MAVRGQAPQQRLHPLPGGRQDENLLRVVSEREWWFGVVMGAEKSVEILQFALNDDLKLFFNIIRLLRRLMKKI